MHQDMAATLDTVVAEIKIRRTRRARRPRQRPRWPMIILRTPKGWTGPKDVDGKTAEDSWRSHQIPVSELREKPSTSTCSKPGCGATSLTNSSMRPANCKRTWRPSPRTANAAWSQSPR